MSSCSYTLDKSCSKTIIANTEVPAETLPVFFITVFVATMPVPASPSGGHIGQPASRVPDGSKILAPSSVK